MEKDIPKSAGFRWNPKEKHWATSDISIAKKLEQYFSEQCINDYNNLTEQNKTNIELSNSSESNIEVPIPEGVELYPFQKAGIEYMLKRDNTLLLNPL